MRLHADNEVTSRIGGVTSMGVADYDITVAGELPPEFAAAFTPFVVNSERGTSTIRAEQIDDAALLGLLARTGELALALVRVERVEPGST